MKKSLWCLLLGYTFLFYLAGCDTDDGRIVDPDTEFQLYPPDYGEIGYTENYNITTWTTGTIEPNTIERETEVSGTYVSLIGNIGLPDATVDTFSESVSLEVTSQNGAVTINGIIWYDSSTNEPVYRHETISGTVLPPQTITATPLDISILPPTAKVGDFGTGTSWIYNDGRRSDSNWFLEASRRGGAWLTSESTVNDGDTLLREYIHSVKINERGERESIYLELVDYVSNFTMTISGDRTN